MNGKPGRKSRGERQFVGAKIPVALLEKLDAARGDDSRTDYIWSALAQHLGMENLDPLAAPQSGVAAEQLVLDQASSAKPARRAA